LRRLGFAERISGSHHVFSRKGVEEIVIVQPKGKLAKSYQVAQIRDIILKYRLVEESND
jgi:predicted RNA binding protein YcfA (HicA-like mRNA interferase family)